jgi:hypothetical protein
VLFGMDNSFTEIAYKLEKNILIIRKSKVKPINGEVADGLFIGLDDN